jgi:putative transposase
MESMDDMSVRGDLLPVVREPDLSLLAEQLVASAAERGVQLTGAGGLLTALTRQVLQAALEVEMADHLGFDRGDSAARGAPNIRNGSTPKTVRTEIGEVTIAVPRDRAATFEPQIVPKHRRRMAGFDEAVISLYAKGMTTGDIAAHLADVYDTDVSKDLISRVTDKVLGDMRAWQSRPLDSVYPVILIDAIVLKVRGGAGGSTVGNRPVYVAMGISVDGDRDVLGMWVGPTGGEGAKQWMNMLTELRNRGILDACIVCCDGLKGLPEAIVATWPQASVQTCVVHLVRNTLRYASKKYWQPIARELKEIYTAPTVEAAEIAFEDFAERWSPIYPAMIEMWRRSWNEFTPFLQFPAEVRKIIYTTNGIESLNARFRAATRRRGHFPDEESALKVLYLAVLQREKNRPNPTGKINAWKNVLNTLSLTFGDRLGLN